MSVIAQTSETEIASHRVLPAWVRQSMLLWLPFLLVALLVIVPVLIVMVQSFRVDESWSLQNYVTFFSRPHYIATLKTTFVIATVTTIITMVLALPACAFVSTRSKRVIVIFIGCVMISLAVSGLIRTLSWQVLLSRSGPINTLLVDVGLLQRPVNMLFSRGAVIVGMVQIMLPYAIALIFAGMRRIDLEFVFAARSLGASPLTAFRSAYMPQIRRSLCSAALLVFVLSSGFIITPALLGGTSDMMFGNVMLTDLMAGSAESTAMAATSGVVLSVILAVATGLAMLAGGPAFNVRKKS